MTLNIKIKPAVEEDIPRIFSMIRELAEYERLDHLLEGSEKRLRDSILKQDPPVECVVGWLDGKAVGYALFFHNFSTFQACSGLYLEDIYVKKAFRKKGVGGALFKHVAQIAHERNCGRLEWLVLRWNKPAIEFYRKMGALVFEDFRLCRISKKGLEKLAKSERSKSSNKKKCSG